MKENVYYIEDDSSKRFPSQQAIFIFNKSM